MFDSGSAGQEDEATRRARLEAMQRQLEAAAVGPYGPVAPDGSGSVQQTDLTQRRGEWGASDTLNMTGGIGPMGAAAPAGSEGQRILDTAGSAFSTGGYDMDALRRQAAALAAEADAANAARNTGTTPPGTSGVSSPLTGGSLAGAINQPVKPPVQPPVTETVIKPPTDDRTTSNLLAQMTTNTPTVSGASAGAVSAAGAGTGAGPSGAGSSIINQGTGAGGSLGALTSSIVQQIQGIGQSLAAPGNSPDVGAVFLQQATSILKMLDEQERSLRADAEKRGQTIDPSTQFTLDKIREGLEDNLRTTREDLNRRGLYDSGVLLELEGKQRKGALSDQAMVLASRLSKLQDELSRGLSSIRSQKVSTLSSFGRDAAQAQFTSGESARRQAYDREQAALQAMLNLRGQLGGEQNAAAGRAAASRENELDRAFRAEQAELDRRYGDAQYKAKTAAEFEQNRQAYEYESALIAQRAASGGGARPAAAARTTQPAPDITAEAISDLRSVFTNATEANAAIKEQMAELAAAGVDIAALVDAANGLGSRRIGTENY